MSEQSGQQRGRPSIPIDPQQVEKLAMLQPTIEEAAAFFGCCKRTLIRRLQDDPVCKEAWERGQKRGKLSLRRLQWKHANGAGSSAVQMTIHLSRHWLGETERSLIEMTGKGGGPVQIADVSQLQSLSDEELDALETMARKLGAAPAKPGGDPS